ncbi:MAG: hypothetical protein RIB03_05060 [Henriciella sp.]|uniref:hypothetical protein n=1 Tax=Henriciella sp. TaxID=1968823 RepID=UPI0032EB4565
MISVFRNIMAALMLAITLGPAAIAQADDQNAPRADMSAKARTCKEAGPKINGAMDCFRTCAKNARTLQNAPGLTADAVAEMHAACNAKYDVAQQGEATPPPAASGPTMAERAARLPEMAAYCRSAETRMGCPVDPSEPNALERTQMCNVAGPCGRNCGDEAMIARLKTAPSRRDLQTINRCEENHGALKAWLDG